jgi:hypothetical protein
MGILSGIGDAFRMVGLSDHNRRGNKNRRAGKW